MIIRFVVQQFIELFLNFINKFIHDIVRKFLFYFFHTDFSCKIYKL